MVVGVFGDGGGPVVADRGCKGGDQHQAAGQQRLDPCSVGFEALDAEAPETLTAPSQQLDAFEQVVGDQRLKDIQLEVALAGGHLHGGVVAHHLQGHHREALALGGIYLARHD